MNCTISGLCEKDVICIGDGSRIGCVSDVEINAQNGCVTALIISGKQGLFGMGKTQDIRIAWCDIDVIGEDTILVKCSCPKPQ